jgi:hypothetical protein
MTDGIISVEVNCDTGHNYIIIEDTIERLNLSALEVLQLFSNEYGLQLFSQDHTESMLQELGLDEE